MARPHKEPGKPRERIQTWVGADTAWYLKKEVTTSGIPMGEILDEWFKARAKQNANTLGQFRKAQNTKRPIPPAVIKEPPKFDI